MKRLAQYRLKRFPLKTFGSMALGLSLLPFMAGVKLEPSIVILRAFWCLWGLFAFRLIDDLFDRTWDRLIRPGRELFLAKDLRFFVAVAAFFLTTLLLTSKIIIEDGILKLLFALFVGFMLLGYQSLNAIKEKGLRGASSFVVILIKLFAILPYQAIALVMAIPSQRPLFLIVISMLLYIYEFRTDPELKAIWRQFNFRN